MPSVAGRIISSAALLLIATNAYADYGRTEGQFRVLGGGATYTIPIWVPPGPNGVQPAIALTYNSKVGNSVGGVGWSISGLASISRCPRTIHQDTVPSGVDYTANDRFCLNGNRLRLVSGTYGSAGSVYFTEFADYSRITAASAPDGQLYFLVEAKSGLKYQYGYSANARTTAGNAVQSWWVNKVYDRNTNNYVVSYTSAGAGTALPSQIQWTPTSHGAATYRYTMSFEWDTQRIDMDTIMEGANGVMVLNKGLLKKITVSSAGNTVRRYVLGHTASGVTSRSLLTSVKMCADLGESNCFQPLSFTYQTGMAGLTAGAGAPPSGASNGLTSGKFDFNGDGKHDLLYRSGTTLWVSFATTSGFSNGINTGVANGTVGRFLPTGRDGIAAKISNALWVYRWDDSTSTFVGHNTGVSLGTMPLGIPVDFNGDQLADFVNVNSTNNGLQLRLNTSTGAGNPSFSTTVTPSGILPSGWRYMSLYQSSGTGLNYMDVNGDGREDLNALIMSLGEVNDFATLMMVSTGGNYPVPSQNQWLVGTSTVASSIEFNGDTCTDRVIGATVYISGCNGNWASTKVAPATPLQLLDWDGDGKMDFLVDNGGTFGVYRSTGNGFSTFIGTSLPSSGSFFSPDLDGDGLDDLVRLSGSTVSYWTHTPNGYAPPNASNIPDLLSNAADGFGVAHAIRYASTAWSNYGSGATTNYPLQIAGPQIVPIWTTHSSGPGSSYDVYYSYVGARTHATRRSSAGYQRIDETDSRNGLITRTYFEQTFPVTGMVSQHEVMQPNGTTTISRVVNTNGFTTLESAANNQRYFAYPQSSTATQYEVGGIVNGNLLRTVTTNWVYDNASGSAYDISRSITEPASGANGVTGGGVWIEGSYTPPASIHNDTTNWCIGRFARVQQSRSHNLTYGTQTTRTTDVAWDLPKCRPTQTTDEPGSGSLQVITSIGYDAFGNVDTTTVTGTGMAPRTTSSSYSNGTHTTGQFPLSVTNAYGQTSVTAWNYDSGLPTSATDPNGIATSWQYDAFGRRIQEYRPDSTYTTWDYLSCTSCDTRVRIYVDRNDRTANGSAFRRSLQYFDHDERAIYDYELRMDGYFNRTVRYFDTSGQLYREELPVSNAGNSVGDATFAYDLIGRPTTISRPISDTNPGAQSTTIYYEGLTTRTVDAQGKVSRDVSNAAGQQVQTIDNDGYRQLFDYDGFGNRVRVTDDLGNTLQSSTYNLRGMLTARTDMDMGAWSFTPNALGELVSQTDAKNQTTTFQFDLLGRLITRTEAEGTSTWIWGTSAAARNVGRLASLSGPGYSEAYSYDAAGRMASTTISADTSYQFDYAYNSIGEIDTITYPVSTAGYRFTAHYQYSYGYLWRVRDLHAGTDLWTASAYDAFDNVTQATLGNGLVTHRSYDAITGLLKSIQTGPGGGTAIQNLSYEWDLVGNLKKRKDLNQGNLTEEFFYDNLYRLDYSTLNGVTNLDVGYDAMGNITSKWGPGNYTYHPTKKHQVLSTSNGWSFSYDNNGNMTSGRGATITWTSFNYPASIANGSDTSTFEYTPDRSYWRQISNYTNGGSATTVYIGGLLEKVANSAGIDYKHFVRTPTATIIVSRRADGQNLAWYNVEDHLGSNSVVTTSAGAIQMELSYDAFGQRRGAAWSGPPTSSNWTNIAGTTRRGYTDHTMLDNLSLIHMNGRAYDPLIGRFLSADPVYEDMGETQSWNRYSYVNNNPLRYTDPTGFEPDGGEIVVTGINNRGEPSQVGGADTTPGGCVNAGGVRMNGAACHQGQGANGSTTANSETAKRQVDVCHPLGGPAPACLFVTRQESEAYSKTAAVGGVAVVANIVPIGKAIGWGVKGIRKGIQALRAYSTAKKIEKINPNVIREIVKLADNAKLTKQQVKELGKNLEAVLEKSLRGKASSGRVQDIVDLLKTDPRFRFLDQVPAAHQKIADALAKYGIRWP
jgi:RHS repeat-associated protein